MTNEELLEYAKKHYPVGTKYHPVGYGAEDKKLIITVSSSPSISMGSGIHIEAGWGWIYNSREGWAEIVVDEDELKEALNIIYRD